MFHPSFLADRLSAPVCFACRAAAASAKNEVEVDCWRTLLPADDENPGSFGGSDRECDALVDEVLVSGEPLASVARETFADLRLRADGSGNGHVALRKRDSDGKTEADDLNWRWRPMGRSMLRPSKRVA